MSRKAINPSEPENDKYNAWPSKSRLGLLLLRGIFRTTPCDLPYWLAFR
jgi:hypothetical protein